MSKDKGKAASPNDNSVTSAKGKKSEKSDTATPPLSAKRLETATAEIALQRFSIEATPSLHVVGTFDAGITVLRQQARALNLAWAMIEAGKIAPDGEPPTRIAVIGAGFAGLTFAAAMLVKEVNCRITLFEEHDTLLPLQQGSDTRWLHPHIYDWPEVGSESDVAMLPVLNWTAARASDVAVQILQQWRRIVSKHARIDLFCNTRHLQLSPATADPRQARIEWIGDRREAKDGTSCVEAGSALGRAECFDEVVLSVGFGIEDGQPSYWRNETMGQPNLHQRRLTHLVSGQGDGALIDLFRVRISQYRQDRILEEMFLGADELVAKLRSIKLGAGKGSGAPTLFAAFDELFGVEAVVGDKAAKEVLERLERRLRRDTDAVLHLKVHEMAELLEPETSRTSFQNALLAYLLYRVGGFAPSRDAIESLCERYSIAPAQVVKRHGVKRLPQLERILSKQLFGLVQQKVSNGNGFARQAAEPHWPGGYFGYPGPSWKKADLDDDKRSVWRKEYLPGPTEMVAATICGAVVGAIYDMRPHLEHVRVTLHRVLPIGTELLLQQACDYQGKGFDPEATAARTYPAENAMIGLAWRCQRGARTRADASEGAIVEAMKQLNLHEAAREMMPSISYVLALPVMQLDPNFQPPGPVAAVLYLDSKDNDFWLRDEEIARLSGIVRRAFAALDEKSFPGVRNIGYRDACPKARRPSKLPRNVAGAIELLKPAYSPVIDGKFVLNFDRADPASIDGVSKMPSCTVKTGTA
ncbi:NAD(P)-binding protein [Sphingopyxis terrae subsp. ummariensis]